MNSLLSRGPRLRSATRPTERAAPSIQGSGPVAPAPRVLIGPVDTKLGEPNHRSAAAPRSRRLDPTLDRAHLCSNRNSPRMGNIDCVSCGRQKRAPSSSCPGARRRAPDSSDRRRGRQAEPRGDIRRGGPEEAPRRARRWGRVPIGDEAHRPAGDHKRSPGNAAFILVVWALQPVSMRYAPTNSRRPKRPVSHSQPHSRLPPACALLPPRQCPCMCVFGLPEKGWGNARWVSTRLGRWAWSSSRQC